jgi:hypothetical protein
MSETLNKSTINTMISIVDNPDPGEPCQCGSMRIRTTGAVNPLKGGSGSRPAKMANKRRNKGKIFRV